MHIQKASVNYQKHLPPIVKVTTSHDTHTLRAKFKVLKLSWHIKDQEKLQQETYSYLVSALLKR